MSYLKDNCHISWLSEEGMGGININVLITYPSAKYLLESVPERNCFRLRASRGMSDDVTGTG
jgi:hypothetical protein